MDHRSSITPWDLECMLSDETAEPKALPLSLLEEITDGFSDQQEIGRGGFAVVYKGMLENRTVAVKTMSDAYMDEKVFHREVECLMMAKNKNIVRFLGYCADRQGSMERYDGKLVMADVNQRLLCFEYLPKGSLDNYITDTTRGLRWRERYQIITGICQGLHYLHQKNIVHLDLKPANILLDDNLVPKITDFGISRCFQEIQSRVLTMMAGTIGYLAPESFNNMKVTYQHSYPLDIYSLGVVITEILTGERGYHNVDNVVESWSNMLEKSHIEVEQEQVRVCAEIGIDCTNFNPTKRPDTQHIISRLNKSESINGYVKTGVLTSHKVVESWSKSLEKLQREVQQEQVQVDKTKIMDGYIKTGANTSQRGDVVFTVRNEKGYELKQLRDLNNLQGSLFITGLENVTSRDEALEANLAAKERLTMLILKWNSGDRRCNPEVIEGLCPPVGPERLEICGYQGLRYPDWMVGKENGGPKDLHELSLNGCGEGPAPQIVEAFPHLCVLKLMFGTWNTLPDNMEHLTSLKDLEIMYCMDIRSLPTLPQSLEKFDLAYCNDGFMKSCVTFGHPNWQKIEHIPNKTIRGLSTKDRRQAKILSGISHLRAFWHCSTA